MSEIPRWCGNCKFGYNSMKVPPCSECKERDGVRHSQWIFRKDSTPDPLTKVDENSINSALEAQP